MDFLIWLVVELVLHLVAYMFRNAPPTTRRAKVKVKAEQKRARIRVKRALKKGRCVLCMADVHDGEQLTHCDTCQTTVHQECVAELGRQGCPTLGCGGTLAPTTDAPEPRGVFRRRTRGRG